MKPILIDEIQEEFGSITSGFTVEVDGVKYEGYQIAKPMNYDPEYSTKEERQEMANLVLEGKAIAVQFFSDLTPEEQSAYVKSKLTSSGEEIETPIEPEEK